jgi:hypothetical protein
MQVGYLGIGFEMRFVLKLDMVLRFWPVSCPVSANRVQSVPHGIADEPAPVESAKLRGRGDHVINVGNGFFREP